MSTRRMGFSLLEMLIVVLLGGLVLTMGTRQYNGVSNQRAVINAANAMVLTSHRARSEAMRSGRLTYMAVEPDAGVVRVSNGDGDVIHTMDMGTYGGTMSGSEFTVCYAARGYALPGCTDISGTRTVAFVRGVDTTAVAVMPLGQVRRIR